MSDAFDAMFAGKTVKTTVRRKLADGSTRSASLSDGVVPESLTLESIAEAAMKGVSLSRRTTDRGAGLAQSVAGVTGAASRSAILAMGDTPPAGAVPPAVARRSRTVAPSTNGTHAPEPTAS